MQSKQQEAEIKIQQLEEALFQAQTSITEQNQVDRYSSLYIILSSVKARKLLNTFPEPLKLYG